MQPDAQARTVNEAIIRYQQAAVPSSNHFLKRRANELYGGFVKSMFDKAHDLRPKIDTHNGSPAFELLCTGIRLTAEAIQIADMKLTYIESDHIHNVPIMLLPGKARSIAYYLQQERDLYLCRLRESQNAAAVENAMHLFKKLWWELGRDLATDD